MVFPDRLEVNKTNLKCAIRGICPDRRALDVDSGFSKKEKTYDRCVLMTLMLDPGSAILYDCDSVKCRVKIVVFLSVSLVNTRSIYETVWQQIQLLMAQTPEIIIVQHIHIQNLDSDRVFP